MSRYKSQYERMTQQSVPALILTLGVPTMISMFVTTIYNMADSYFVGQINTSASGATSVVMGLMAILQAIGFMFGHGSGSIISRNSVRRISRPPRITRQQAFTWRCSQALACCFSAAFS